MNTAQTVLMCPELKVDHAIESATAGIFNTMSRRFLSPSALSSTTYHLNPRRGMTLALRESSKSLAHECSSPSRGTHRYVKVNGR